MAQGVTLDQYRAAETAEDGFAIGRPIGIGHFGLGARLDVDYGLAPLRVPSLGGAGEDVLVEHQLTGQLGLAIGVFDRFVGTVRLPLVLVMEGPAAAGDPSARGTALGDLILGARWVLYGERGDGEQSNSPFAVALAAEGTIPTAEAASSTQDLAGEAGPTFTPELQAEVRFSIVRITANVGARLRESSRWQRVRAAHELTWGLGVGVDLVEDLLDATIEGYGATPFDDFAASDRSPVETILGVRLRPGHGLAIGLAGGIGIGDGYGAPRLRAILNVGWTTDFDLPRPAAREGDPQGSITPAQAERARRIAALREARAAARAEAAAREAERRARVVDHDYGQLDRDGDHIADASDQCPLDREDYDEIADEDGCPEQDADADQVTDADDACPLTEGVRSESAGCNGCPARACISATTGQITISERVEFATGSDRILASSEPVLGDVLSILRTNDQLVRIRIEGHTDDRGPDARNARLSQARAASVRRWLVEHGLPAERFEAWGCGEAHPIAPNRNNAGRQANRRVEFHITEPPTAGLTLREGCQQAQ